MYDTIFFPIITGISIGIYEELALAYPEQLTKFQAQIQTDSIGNMVAHLDKNVAGLWNLKSKDVSIWWANSMFSACWQQAIREYEKYDETYGIADKATELQEPLGNPSREKKSPADNPRPLHADRMTRAIIRNTPGVKRFMESRRAFLWVLSTIGDRMGKYNEWGKFALRFAKAGTLFLQLVSSKTLFNISKYGTRIFSIIGMNIAKSEFTARMANFIKTSITHKKDKQDKIVNKTELSTSKK